MDDGLRLPEPVTLTLVLDVHKGDAAVRQGLGDDDGLIRRNDLVIETLVQRHGNIDLIDRMDR